MLYCNIKICHKNLSIKYYYWIYMNVFVVNVFPRSGKTQILNVQIATFNVFIQCNCIIVFSNDKYLEQDFIKYYLYVKNTG